MMPDVPERCPLCDSETLYTGVNLYHACGTRSTPEGAVIMEGWECAVRQRDAAYAEAERVRQQYETLRAGVERVAQDLHELAHATARGWQQSGDPYHDGASDAYYMAEEMVRRVLAETGGGKA